MEGEGQQGQLAGMVEAGAMEAGYIMLVTMDTLEHSEAECQGRLTRQLVSLSPPRWNV